MKKYLQYVVIMALIVFLLFQNINTEGPAGIPLGNSALASQIPKQSSVLNDIVLLPEEKFEEEEVMRMINRLSALPINLLESIRKEEIQVRLFQESLTDFPSAAHLKGVIPRGYKSNITWDEVPGIGGSKLVLVKIGHSNPGQGHGSVNLELHELAHSIHRYLLDDLLVEITLQELMEKESGLLFHNREYFLHYKEEFFAESFAMFYLNSSTNKTLYERAPKTHAFFLQLEQLY
ncbi:toxin [Bacillus spongiae]|uniref:Toxin n=1 Tax=Bacillus spongiae TaxID=2683610 RepID=A0ABU8HD65_9BACI